MISKKKKFLYHLNCVDTICKELGYGDIWAYARSKEVIMSIVLDHTIADKFLGEDAIDKNGNKLEYKSTTNKQNRIQATYSGISVQETWNDQLDYLKNNKIRRYSKHYIARFEGTKVKECWELTGDAVYKILVPKLKKQFDRMQSGFKPKDPRLSAIITQQEIYDHGVQVI